MTDQTTTVDLDDDIDESRAGFHQLMDSVHLDETFIDPLIDADRLRTLRQVLAAIEDPEQRAGGLGWETARDIVQRFIDASPNPDEGGCRSGVCNECEDCYCDDEDCAHCGGTGVRVPEHCCDCGGGVYDCTCCGQCGSTDIARCGCKIPVQMADGTTMEV